MTNSRWRRLRQIYDEAQQLPAAERAQFIAAQAGDDETLRAELEALLAEDVSAFAKAAGDAPQVDAPLRALGEFELREEIGRGGMGIVYRGYDPRLGREVAIKVLPVGMTTQERDIDRFHREARAVAKLSHPGVISIFADGESQGYHYFAMELLERGDLGAELELQRGEDRSQTLLLTRGDDHHVEEVSRLISRVADALHHAHSHDVVHRDIKPSNLLIDDRGELVITDFGLVKDETQGSLTVSREILGSPHYMSPEQAAGAKTRIDHRTDIYSLGAVLYEMLTMERLFAGDTADQVISQIASREPRRIRTLNPRVPRDLEIITETALAKDPEDRYPTALAMAEDLGRFLAHEAIVARPPPWTVRTKRAIRKNAWPIGTACLVIVGVVVGLLIAQAHSHRQRIEAHLDQLRRASAHEDWLTADSDQLADARRSMLELTEQRSKLDGESTSLVQSAAERFSTLRSRMIQLGTEKIERARSPERTFQVVSSADESLLSGLLLLTRALKIFPGDEEITTSLRDDLSHPRVTIRLRDEAGGEVPGHVSGSRLNPLSGLAVSAFDMGTLPVELRPLPPGHYRFVVTPAVGVAREYTRILLRGRDEEPIDVKLTIVPDGPPMVRIEGGVLRLPEDPGAFCPNQGQELFVPTFLIDAAPVSNAEYRQFVDATGADAPYGWQFFPSDGTYDDYPVTLISWYAARDYAEWCGKRLVGHAEWEWAARGPDGEKLLPLDGGGFGYRGNVFGPNECGGQMQARVERYMRNASKCREPSDAIGRSGLFHLLGNVMEWTEASGFERLADGEYAPRPESRLVLSSPWYAEVEGYDLSTHSLAGPEDSYGDPRYGFRCARSAAP